MRFFVFPPSMAAAECAKSETVAISDPRHPQSWSPREIPKVPEFSRFEGGRGTTSGFPF